MTRRRRDHTLKRSDLPLYAVPRAKVVNDVAVPAEPLTSAERELVRWLVRQELTAWSRT